MNSVSIRRLAGALAISMVLHLLVIIPLRIPIDSTVDPLQLFLQASLSRTPPVEAPSKKSSPPPKKQMPTPSAKQLTTPKGAKHTALADQPATPPAEDESIFEPAAALILDQALLPEYPAAALAQGLESCVLSSVQVSAAGEVESVIILASDYPGVFDESVIDAQKSTRYAPARQGSEGIPSRVLAVSTFVIQPGKQLDCPLKYAPLAEKIVRSNAP